MHYARPYRSNDKAEREGSHGFVWYVFPKGKSLDGLTQDDVNAAFGNINSLVRAGKGDRTPSKAAEWAFGKAFLEALGIEGIDKRKVRLALLIWPSQKGRGQKQPASAFAIASSQEARRRFRHA